MEYTTTQTGEQGNEDEDMEAPRSPEDVDMEENTEGRATSTSNGTERAEGEVNHPDRRSPPPHKL